MHVPVCFGSFWCILRPLVGAVRNGPGFGSRCGCGGGGVQRSLTTASKRRLHLFGSCTSAAACGYPPVFCDCNGPLQCPSSRGNF